MIVQTLSCGSECALSENFCLGEGTVESGSQATEASHDAEEVKRICPAYKVAT